jgi:CDP-glycerol glycerophosphotransferase (TagB/SpsB family)
MLVVPIGDRYLENNTVDRDIVHFLTEILPLDWQILVRFPPGDYVREIERNTTQFGRINVLYDRASQPFENIKMTEITHTDDQRLIETIQSADLVVSGPSTMVIDAAFLGKPTILFGFDGYEKRNYLTSIRRYYDYDNFAPILRSGGARLAESKQEFEKLVHEYIKDPSKDEQGRRALALAEATWMDGQSTERLLQALVG